MSRIKRFKPPKVTTVVGQGTVITGDVEFSGGLHLDGAIKGNVNGVADSNATLTISELGRVEGDVHVENLILNGVVVGDVYANERAELAANARVTGTVYYRLLEMAMGAEVNGKLVHSEEQEPRKLEYDGGGEQAETATDAG
ncbi:MAG: polymer-forming cytoskeletal protein [Gammaproteobacteria bacterium]|nr:polymer-forming cytoskeletal protein [Gammaproteobacteria bacterium]MCB1925441.1 polymer-forming cytoskeletal protein [Gammaproteobacteria bacterium]